MNHLKTVQVIQEANNRIEVIHLVRGQQSFGNLCTIQGKEISPFAEAVVV